VTGYLTVTQKDLAAPGRGLDLVISRVYETPAVFHGSDPYDYEAPPVDVGKGWQLNFPHVGSKYLHLWGGTVQKIPLFLKSYKYTRVNVRVVSIMEV